MPHSHTFKVEHFVTQYNKHCKPFTRTASAA